MLVAAGADPAPAVSTFTDAVAAGQAMRAATREKRRAVALAHLTTQAAVRPEGATPTPHVVVCVLAQF